ALPGGCLLPLLARRNSQPTYPIVDGSHRARPTWVSVWVFAHKTFADFRIATGIGSSSLFDRVMPTFLLSAELIHALVCGSCSTHFEILIFCSPTETDSLAEPNLSRCLHPKCSEFLPIVFATSST